MTAPEKSGVEIRLQRFDLLADGGLGDVELFTGTGETQVPRCRLEYAKLVELRKMAGDSLSQRFSPA